MKDDPLGAFIAICFFLAVWIVGAAIVATAPLSLFILGAGGVWLAGYLINRWYQNLPSTQERRKQEESEKSRAEHQAMIREARATYEAAALPGVEDFKCGVAQAYLELRRCADKPFLSAPLAQPIIDVFADLYQKEFPATVPDYPDQYFLRRIREAGQANLLYLRTCVTALNDFTDQVPGYCTQPIDPDPPKPMFMRTVAIIDGDLEHEDDRKWRCWFTDPAYAGAYLALGNAFRANKAGFEQHGMFGDWGWFKFGAGLDPEDKDYRKEAEQERLCALPTQQVLVRTPLMNYLHIVPKDWSISVPWDIPFETRFRHHWFVAPHGAGKTSVLSHLINHDLDHVAKEALCSLFVMDSQNELIPGLARLKRFAPGGDLYGQLIYLEYDPDYPLALNIFDVSEERLAGLSSAEREQLNRGASELSQFFLNSIVQAETSPQMDVVLRYLVPALMSIPDATIQTFKDLLKADSYGRYWRHFAKLDFEVRDWLKNRLHDKSYATTREAIQRRLDAFTADSVFRRMFRHPRSKLDLFTELQSAKVILINTNRGLMKDATEPFGRFFIARLLQATEERMLLPKASRLPVFCYIDEATDYIAREENVAELIDRARKQLVALTLAHQREDQVKSANVLSALRNCAIQTTATEPGTVSVTIKGEAAQLTVPYVNFAELPQMSDAEWNIVRAEMRGKYAFQHSQGFDEYSLKPNPEIIPPERGKMRRKPDADDALTEPSEDY